MAVRFDAAADRLLRTTDLINYNAAYTVCFWVYISVDLNAYSTFFSLNNNSYSAMDWLGTADDGVTLDLTLLGPNTGETTGTTLSVGAWNHVAMIRASATDLRMFLAGAQTGSTLTGSVSARTAVTRMETGGEFTTNADLFNGRIAYIKAWTAALTAAELANEMHSIVPSQLANLYAYWPTLAGATERLAEYSGNGRGWTAGGTLTDEDGPPVAWGFRPVVILPITAAGGGGDQNAAGTVAIANAIALPGTTSSSVTVTGTLAVANAIGLTGTAVAGDTPVSGALAVANAIGLDGSATPGTATATGDIAIANGTAVDGTAQPGGITIDADVAIANGLALDGAATPTTLVGGDIAIANAIGLAGTAQPGTATATGDIAIANGAGLPGTAQPGGIVATGTVAIANASALEGTAQPGNVNTTGTLAVANGTAQTGTAQAGNVNTTGGLAIANGLGLTGTAQPGTISANGDLAVADGTGGDGSALPGAITISAAVAIANGLALAGRAVDTVPSEFAVVYAADRALFAVLTGDMALFAARANDVALYAAEAEDAFS